MLRSNHFVRAAVLGCLFTLAGSNVIAAPGDLLATVTIPSHSAVGGTVVPAGNGDVVFVSPRSFGAGSLDIYATPNGFGNQAATLLASKSIVDADNDPLEAAYGCIAWDSKRNVLWAANASTDLVYSIDLGNPLVSGDVVATEMFSVAAIGGIDLCDGLAYDPFNDTLWYSPDVNSSVYELGLGDADPLGQLLSTVSPKNAAGATDGGVSGVTVGLDDTLYIARNGAQEIRRVDKVSGDFVSNFSQTAGRAESLMCDTVTFAPLTVMYSVELYVGFEVFELEPGTCANTSGEEVEIRSVPVLGRSGLLVLTFLLGIAAFWSRRFS